MGWIGERERKPYEVEPLLPLPSPKKAPQRKKSWRERITHSSFHRGYAVGWHPCQPTGGRISQLPSRSIFGITTKTCTTRRFSHDHHASTMTIWNVSQSLSPASLGQRFSLSLLNPPHPTSSISPSKYVILRLKTPKPAQMLANKTSTKQRKH